MYLFKFLLSECLKEVSNGKERNRICLCVILNKLTGKVNDISCCVCEFIWNINFSLQPLIQKG